MYQKLIIKAEIEVLTGLHIGGSSAYSAIGAVSSPIIKDPITQLPIIPGSSIKGKLRTLMARNLPDQKVADDPSGDPPEIKRLFGSSQGDNTESNTKGVYTARLQFCDCFMNNAKELEEIGTTEVKFENTIGRFTARANPRQIERVIRGAKFDFNLIYNVPLESDCTKSLKDEISEDFKNLANGFKLLQMDYLGGSGTRGYGKIKFNNFEVTTFSCDENKSSEYMENVKTKLIEQLKKVDASENLGVN